VTGLAALAALQEAAESAAVPQGILSDLDVGSSVRAALMIVLGVPAVFLVSRWMRARAATQVSAQAGLIAGKLVFYVGLATLVISTMTELGFSLTPLLGAAGVVGVALGFASQTSVSNVIAGLFLIAESPFVVGDLIQVGDVTGFVLSVDTMSVKLRTLDNKFVRIPNETLVKSTVTTITRFPIRRLDVKVGVAYKESPERVRRVLLEIAEENPIALMEPEPLVLFEGFGDSSLNFLFGVWTTRQNWLALKNSIQVDLKERFDAEGIEIPFPHRTLYVGSETGAFPIRIAQEEPATAAEVEAEAAGPPDAPSPSHAPFPSAAPSPSAHDDHLPPGDEHARTRGG
jgi:small-conductance mechanosensitive channel